MNKDYQSPVDPLSSKGEAVSESAGGEITPFDGRLWCEQDIGGYAEIHGLINNDEFTLTGELGDHEMEYIIAAVNNYPGLSRLRARVEELEGWIAEEGSRSDTCTRWILNRVCDGCRCGKALKGGQS